MLRFDPWCSRRMPVRPPSMRYLVTARVKPGRERALEQEVNDETLGRGSVAEDHFVPCMKQARAVDEGQVKWVEICFCPTPLQEERSFWEEHFELVKVQDAHDRKHCRDLTGEEPWACETCDCTARLEARLASRGRAFLDVLREPGKKNE